MCLLRVKYWMVGQIPSFAWFCWYFCFCHFLRYLVWHVLMAFWYIKDRSFLSNLRRNNFNLGIGIWQFTGNSLHVFFHNIGAFYLPLVTSVSFVDFFRQFISFIGIEISWFSPFIHSSYSQNLFRQLWIKSSSWTIFASFELYILLIL